MSTWQVELQLDEVMNNVKSLIKTFIQKYAMFEFTHFFY